MRMAEKGGSWEEVKVAGDQLVETVKKLVHEGNVRRIIIKDEQGHTFMEIPLTVGVVGAVLLPIWAALGALAALVTGFKIAIERVPEGNGKASGKPSEEGAEDEHSANVT
jgi:hypothetical protein